MPALNWLASVLALLHGLLFALMTVGCVAAIAGRLRGRPRFEIAFYVVLAAIIFFDLVVGECIVTTWEKRLRDLAEPGSAYTDSFLGHYAPWLAARPYSVVSVIVVALAVLAAPAWRAADHLRRRRRQT